MPLNPQVGKLTMGKSRRLLVHPRGYLKNNKPYKEEFLALEKIPRCFRPKGLQQHTHPYIAEPCASLHWQTVTGGLPTIGRYVQRTVGDTTYAAASPIEGEKPDFGIAIIGWFPIDELHLVYSDDRSDMDKALDLLKNINSSIPTYITDF